MPPVSARGGLRAPACRTAQADRKQTTNPKALSMNVDVARANARPIAIAEAEAPAALFKQAMRGLAGGISVVTAGIGDDRTGATVTSATSFAVDPPTMIVSLNLSSSTWPVIRRHGHFCVNVVDLSQQAVADRFAGKGGVKGTARYEGAEWTRLASGAPVLVGALAAIDCTLDEAIERYSHAIVLGRVRAVTLGQGSPLVYAGARYGAFVP